MDTNKLQQILVQLAAEAANPNLTTTLSPTLPSTWKSLTTQRVPAPAIGDLQILLAYGNAGTDVIACMAIGLPWANLLGSYHTGFSARNRQPLPINVMGDPHEDSVVFSLYVEAYNYLRKPVWNALSYLDNPGVKDKPLYITGMGLGGPLAQIVAMDFRPGQKGPSNQNPPQATQPPSYVFSTGNIGTYAFQTLYNQRVKNAYRVTAGSVVLPVDLFPSEPAGDGLNYFPLGDALPVNAAVPKPYFTPWKVRDSNFYLTALGGTPFPYTKTATSIPDPPPGFSQALAFSLGKLVALTYQQATQRDTTGMPNPAPYVLVKTIDYDGSLIAAVFTNPDSVVIAFRGTITFKEFLAMEAATLSFTTDYGQTIVNGAGKVYYESANGNTSTLADVVREQVLTYKTRKLYLTGHGFGGVLANVAAADLTFSAPVFPVAGLYTFGANYWASQVFSGIFNKALGAVSYQVLRADDDVATALQTLPIFNPVNSTVLVNGELEFPGDTSHDLSGYLSLLDPSRVIPVSDASSNP